MARLNSRSGLGGEPVVRVKPEDTSRGARDLPVEVRVPPDVVGIDDDPNPVGFETLGDVQRLREGNDHGALLHEHRVKRFDSELYAYLAGVRRELRDAFLHHDPGGFEVPLRRGPADEDEHVGPQGSSLIYGATVVFETGTAFGGPTAGNIPPLQRLRLAVRHPARCVRSRRVPSRKPYPATVRSLDANAGTSLRCLPHAPVVRGLLVEAQAR